jgi:serine/threonine protein phosphatase PrpC
MGGHRRGDVASSIIVEAFSSIGSQNPGDADVVQRVLQTAHDDIRARAGASQREREMGSTAVGAVLVGAPGAEHWVVFNVGDSRAYRFSEQRLEQISTDHSLVQELVSAGRLHEDAARDHPDRHVITRAVGIDDRLTPDFMVRQVVPGERFLLCSDGLHDELSDQQIATVLELYGDAPSAAQALVDTVLAGPANDNVTVVVIDVLDASDNDDPSTGDVPIHDGESPEREAQMIEVPKW